MANQRDMRVFRKINQIVIHCSDSEFGGWKLIDDWHKQRGWSGIGYHYVICNTYPTSKSNAQPNRDGRIEYGRDMNVVGGHVRGFNAHSLGICVIFKERFTGEQFNTLVDLVTDVQISFPDIKDNIVGHYELDDKKTCPNFNMDWFRNQLA